MFVTIIGSSPGESVIIQFESGEVITIDCCQIGGKNFTIENIDRLGIDYDKIVYNVVTHFHDDHIKGISDLIAKCPKSKIVIPDAWTKDVFLRFVATVSEEVTLSQSSVTREIEKIFNQLGSTPERLFSVSELISLHPPAGAEKQGNESLLVLTPTAARKTRFLAKLAQEISNGDAAALKFCLTNKNWTSISCLLRYDGGTIFLGGDVENVSPDFDIRAIHDGHLAKINQYSLVKLPHHGSDTSFCDRLRDRIHNEETIVAITPYPKGHKVLPNHDTRAYLKDAKNVVVLSGERIKLKRAQRLRRNKLFNFEPIRVYQPGVMDFMDGLVELKSCKPLDEFLANVAV